MKKVLSLAVAAALAAPAIAMADSTIYGKVRQAVDLVNLDTGAAEFDDDNIKINDYTSRLGFKGSEDLGNGLSAVYKIEYGLKISTSANEFSGDGSLGARNAFVGLAGGFGTFVIGRHDTPLKISTGSLDYFGDTVVDGNGTFTLDGVKVSYTENLLDRRADGTIAYISPSFSGLTLALALVPGENNDADGISDAYSAAAMYSNGGIYAAAAVEGADGNIDAIGIDGADLTQVRVGGGYDAGMWKVAGVYETVSVDNPGSGDDLVDSTSWNINGAITLGPGKVVAKWFDYKNDGAVNPNDLEAVGANAVDHDGFGLGYHYDLSKRTQLMANYVNTSYDEIDVDYDVFSFQLNHTF